jgi:hypothetical protein
VPHTHQYIGQRVRTPDGSGRCIDVLRSGNAIVELDGIGARKIPLTAITLEAPTRKCIHCGGPSRFGNVCDGCLELLAGLEDEQDQAPPPAPRPEPPLAAPKPAPRPRPSDGVFHPSPEDEAAYRELVAAGAFDPPAKPRPPRPFSYGPHSRRR